MILTISITIFRSNIVRCIQDIKGVIGDVPNDDHEDTLRKAYSDRVSETLKCQETISQQAERISLLRSELRDKDDTIAELRNVIAAMSVGGKVTQASVDKLR